MEFFSLWMSLSKMKISKAIELASKKLNYFERPRLEAEILLSHHLKCDRVWIHLHGESSFEDFDTFWGLVKRRVNFEPIEYITNRVSFYWDEFFIKEGALIPRPESEILVDKTAWLIKRVDAKVIAEIGVGSGAVSVTLAKMFPELSIIATDISDDALSVAKKNIELHNVESQIDLVKTSLLDEVGESIDLIVSNPPYIPNFERDNLEPNVIDFEPEEALFVEGDGTRLLKEIISLSLKRGVKALVCEMGYDQREEIGRFLDSFTLKEYGFYKDLAGLDRGFWLIP
jgi:release factor glutamine methyltransferase